MRFHNQADQAASLQPSSGLSAPSSRAPRSQSAQPTRSRKLHGLGGFALALSCERRQLPKRTLAAMAAGSLLALGILSAIVPHTAAVWANDDADVLSFLRSEGEKARNAARATQERASLRAYAPTPASAGRTLAASPGHAAIRSATRESSPPRARMKSAKASQVASRIDVSGSRAYCVRLCDGFYFPLAAAGADNDVDAACAALCPGSATRAYLVAANSQSIDAGQTREGQAYASLPAAYQHTFKNAPSCGCRADRADFSPIVPLTKDFTLRRGDGVVTANGLRVFLGAKRWPYQPSDFARLPPKDLPKSLARALSAIESKGRGLVVGATQDHAPGREGLRLRPALGFARELPKDRALHGAVEDSATREREVRLIGMGESFVR